MLKGLLRCALIVALGAACSSAGESDESVDASTDTSLVADAPTSDLTCDAIRETIAMSTRVNADDLEAMRSQLPKVVEALKKLEDAAPLEVRGDATTLREFAEEWFDRISESGFALDPDTLHVWETRQTQLAGESLATWAEEHCSGEIADDALTATVLTVCLPEGSSQSDVQLLFERVQVPSRTGSGVDLADGVRGVSARRDGISVELDAFISPERTSEVIALLSEPPVDRVVEDDESC